MLPGKLRNQFVDELEEIMIDQYQENKDPFDNDGLRDNRDRPITGKLKNPLNNDGGKDDDDTEIYNKSQEKKL